MPHQEVSIPTQAILYQSLGTLYNENVMNVCAYIALVEMSVVLSIRIGKHVMLTKL